MKLTDPHTPINLHQIGNQIIVEFAAPNCRRTSCAATTPPISARRSAGFDVTRLGDGTRIVVDATGDYEQLAYQSDDQYVVEVQPRRKAAAAAGRQAGVHRRAPDAELPGH